MAVYPPPRNGAKNGVFHLVSPTGHLRYPPPLFLGGVESKMRPIVISQALKHPKFAFFRVHNDRITVYPAPPNGPENAFFHLVNAAGQFGCQPPHFVGAGFHYEAKCHHPSAGTSQNAVFTLQTDGVSVYPPLSPNGAEIRFFHVVSPGRQFRYSLPGILGLLSSIMRLILIIQAPS